jgi:hypothetical protein
MSGHHVKSIIAPQLSCRHKLPHNIGIIEIVGIKKGKMNYPVLHGIFHLRLNKFNFKKSEQYGTAHTHHKTLKMALC